MCVPWEVSSAIALRTASDRLGTARLCGSRFVGAAAGGMRVRGGRPTRSQAGVLSTRAENAPAAAVGTEPRGA